MQFERVNGIIESNNHDKPKQDMKKVMNDLFAEANFEDTNDLSKLPIRLNKNQKLAL
jgi:hypothetical protein